MGATSISAVLRDKFIRMTLDGPRDELYIGYIKHIGLLRINGETGELDSSWFPKGDMHATECFFGPDDLLYTRWGPMGYGRWLLRVNREGAVVPFTGDGAMEHPSGGTWPDEKGKFGHLAGTKTYGAHPVPRALAKARPISVVWTGEVSNSSTHTRGLHVSPNGMIVAPIQFQRIDVLSGAFPQYLHDRGIPTKISPWTGRSYVAVIDLKGNYLTANAVGDMSSGHGAFMDRDGNIYATCGRLMTRKDKPYGIAQGGDRGGWGGIKSLVKFRWTGKFPMAAQTHPTDRKADSSVTPEALWVHHGIPGHGGGCTCNNNRSDMDGWARSWIASNQLCSVMVLDANGNAVARVGRYGNVDDADEKYGKIHFSWIRNVAVSDTAMYVADQPNRRVLKAKILYHAEEEVPLP
jgi:hypothetical protein